jgi:DNA-binding PadR family transcriptional regulator
MDDSGSTLLVEPALLILVSLAEEPKHGYAIMQDVKGLTGWAMRAGTLYGALARMERAGWIEEIHTHDYRRRPYALTIAGGHQLTRHSLLFDNLVRTVLKRRKRRGTVRRRA